MADVGGLRFGPIGTAAHPCVDMQRLFSDETPWHTPRMERGQQIETALVDEIGSA